MQAPFKTEEFVRLKIALERILGKIDIPKDG